MNVQQALDSIKVLLFPGDVTYSTASDEPVDLSPRYSVEQSIIPIRSVRSPLLTPIRDIRPVARTPVRSVAPLRGRVRNVPALPADVGPFYYPYQGNYEDYGPTTGLSGVIQGVTSMLNRSFGFVPPITSTMNRAGAGRLQSTLGAAPHITHQRHHVSSYPYHKSSHPETFGRKVSIRPLANHRWSTSKNNYGFGKVPGQWWGGGRRWEDKKLPPCPGGLDCRTCLEVSDKKDCVCCGPTQPAPEGERGRYGELGKGRLFDSQNGHGLRGLGECAPGQTLFNYWGIEMCGAGGSVGDSGAGVYDSGASVSATASANTRKIADPGTVVDSLPTKKCELYETLKDGKCETNVMMVGLAAAAVLLIATMR